MRTRKTYKRLLGERRERLASIDEHAPGIAIRHHFNSAVKVAWVGTWWPWAAGLIQRYRDWKRGRVKIPCERCGTVVRSRDMEIVKETELVCLLCWLGEAAMVPYR